MHCLKCLSNSYVKNGLIKENKGISAKMQLSFFAKLYAMSLIRKETTR